MPRDPPVTSAIRPRSENRSVNMRVPPFAFDRSSGREVRASQGNAAFPSPLVGEGGCWKKKAGGGVVAWVLTPHPSRYRATPSPARGEGKGYTQLDQAALTRRKPFHIAVATPEVSTG